MENSSHFSVPFVINRDYSPKEKGHFGLICVGGFYSYVAVSL
jgi:hypothetical protein